jgi:intracellular sulfur oxidation DsrE/DsrF family protein
MKMHWMAIRFATLFGLGLMVTAPIPAFAQTSVVYHIDDAQVQGLKGLRNIRNHLDVAPDTKITVVTHANGVDILMDGGKDIKSNVDYGPLVGALKSRGVRFEVCEITLKNRNLKKEQFTLDADFTPSGVVRITDLQFKNNFAYIRP